MANYTVKQIASRYAAALLQLAVEKNVLAQVCKDMHYFDRVCIANNRLVAMLKSPVIERKKKLAALQAVFKDKVHGLTLRLFAMVTQKHREALLQIMAQAFLSQYNQHQRIKKARVTTALPLSEQLALQLQQVAKKIAPCQRIILDQDIDKTLIGGYVLQIDDKRLDRSVRKQLHTLKKNCMTGRY